MIGDAQPWLFLAIIFIFILLWGTLGPFKAIVLGQQRRRQKKREAAEAVRQQQSREIQLTERLSVAENEKVELQKEMMDLRASLAAEKTEKARMANAMNRQIEGKIDWSQVGAAIGEYQVIIVCGSILLTGVVLTLLGAFYLAAPFTLIGLLLYFIYHAMNRQIEGKIDWSQVGAAVGTAAAVAANFIEEHQVMIVCGSILLTGVVLLTLLGAFYLAVPFTLIGLPLYFIYAARDSIRNWPGIHR